MQLPASPFSPASLFTPCLRLPIKLAVLFSTAVLALAGVANRAEAQCSTSPCNGGAIAVYANNPAPSSSAIDVTATGSVQTVYVELDGVTSEGLSVSNYTSLSAAAFMLTAPDGQQFEFLGATGDGDDGGGVKGITITVKDGATYGAPNGAQNPAPYSNNVCCYTGVSNWTVKPTSIFLAWPEGDPPLGLNSSQWAVSDGSSTFSGAFTGVPINGTWTLTLQDDDTFCCGTTADPVSITGWKLYYTLNQAAATTTTLSSNSVNNTSFTSGSNSSITLTATVTSQAGSVSEGTVAFTLDGAVISGCGSRALSSGSTSCITAITTEGDHAIGASYSGTSNFAPSPALALEQYVKNHTTLSGGKYCNSGPISIIGGNITPYPSVINVGTDTTALNGSVANVSVTLNGLSSSTGLFEGYGFLLVAPDKSKAYNLDFLSSVGSSAGQSAVDVTFADNNPTAPEDGPLPNATYEATDYSYTADAFVASTAPAPTIPGTFNYSQPDQFGNNPLDFQQAFNGANGNGDWLLVPFNSSGQSMAVTGGWCLSITQNTGALTTESLSSSATPAYAGTPVTFTAAVTSGGSPVISGSVTFTENGSVPAGVTNNTVNLNGNGVAQITTSGLPEGDHHITASYNGTADFNPTSTLIWQRIDTATTVSGAGTSSNPAVVCNPGGIVLPGNPQPENIGAASPNPSNIFVSNMPGSLQSVTVELNGFHTSYDPTTSYISSLLVGPNGTGLDFFSGTGASNTVLSTGNYDFADAAGSTVPQSQYSPGTYEPTSYDSSDTFFADASGTYTLPGSFHYAQPHSNPFTLNGESNGAFTGINPNGVWSLYFDINTHDAGDGASGWCLSMVENLPTVTPSLSHVGSFSQGEQNAQFTVQIANNGPGSTGDPTGGSNPMTVTDSLSSAFTYSGFSGTGWTCFASGQNVTCTNDGSVADGSSYPALTIDVNVNASGSVSNTVSASGAGAPSSVSNTDSFTIGTAPAITSAASTTFAAGTPGTFTVTTTGTPTPAISESGALPSAVTFIDNGNGTATLAGTPAANTGGSYPITLTASNGLSPDAQQSFILTVSSTKAAMISPAPNGPLPGPSVNFTWSTATAATGYSLWIGSTGPGSYNLYQGGVHPVTSVTVNGLPTNGEALYVRLWTSVNGTLQSNDYTYTAAQPAILTSPATTSTLIGPTVTFSWTPASGATGYVLWLGSTGVGSHDLYQGGLHSDTSLTVNWLPTNGETIYARLITSFNGVAAFNDYTYTGATATMTTPASGSTLAGPSVTFNWSANGTGATGYAIWIGSTGPGSNDIHYGGLHPATSLTVNNLPLNGEPLNVRLWTNVTGGYTYNDYVYTAAAPAVIASPVPTTTLGGASATFSWTAVNGATGYALWLGTTAPGSNDLLETGIHPATSVSFNSLPTNGGTIYARLWTSFNGTLTYTDTTFTAASTQ